ncbi:MAG: hypothetical protein DMG47_19235 [Acidobacteria bacterium]|nr:MAG: hypothetical protein DMG47_19235 [Acidobacteriota bacterium]
MLRVAWSLHFVGKWGRRAEDPFSPTGELEIFPRVTDTPKHPGNSKLGEGVPEHPNYTFGAKKLYTNQTQ